MHVFIRKAKISLVLSFPLRSRKKRSLIISEIIQYHIQVKVREREKRDSSNWLASKQCVKIFISSILSKDLILSQFSISLSLVVFIINRLEMKINYVSNGNICSSKVSEIVAKSNSSLCIFHTGSRFIVEEYAQTLPEKFAIDCKTWIMHSMRALYYVTFWVKLKGAYWVVSAFRFCEFYFHSPVTCNALEITKKHVIIVPNDASTFLSVPALNFLRFNWILTDWLPSLEVIIGGDEAILHIHGIFLKEAQ